jgi:purine-nucleoside phosphorylase
VSAAERLVEAAGGPIDVAIVLGSGLSSIVGDRFAHASLPYEDLFDFPIVMMPGHAGEVLAGTWRGKRIAAFSGRVHLYQGCSPAQVTAGVRMARAAGAKIIVLTNAAGSLRDDLRAGDFMLISDHLNLTGCNPLVATREGNPFVPLHDAYSARLRAIARSAARGEYRLHEGVYAGVLGPSYETPAEAAYLRTIGADAVGMSTVLETIVARFLGMEVLGVSVIANAAGTAETSHQEVVAAGHASALRLAELLQDFITNVKPIE